jgi:hyperosmotically inducible protein
MRRWIDQHRTGGIDMNTDETIKQYILDYANWDKRIDASKISVTVDHGNVMLKGPINTYSSFKRLYKYASNCSNVESVKANMSVNYATSQPKDADIVNYIETAFKWDADMNGSDVHVASVDGHVTLSGNIDAFWKKELAEERTASIVGVKDIKNELAIVHTENVSDEILSRNLVSAMKTNKYIDVTKINVNIENAHVNLTGTARSALERDEVYRIALYASGVRSIHNSIKIEY